ncbi:hypothetical protein C8J56DRAFT_919572 [Mycena floridula]|nr:hypothetical protein C8J56DRAFT_919572 [Mycena floridula]
MASSSSNHHSGNTSWPPEPIPPVGYLSRKALPIKRNDAEALTREDVQYDLLGFIFSDTHAVFTPQTPGSSSKITFSDLYVNALYHSSKCSKVLKEKMVETPAFAIELAKISLLTNVGRINTTMAFFPEMKTALRTYHPDGNAQDAPRIKNCLKASLLPSELKSLPPTTPEDIIEKNRAGQRPPTSVVNLIFVLSNHAAPLAPVHFEGQINFLDLFLPKNLASPDRARAFLWHMYHYLEDLKTPNPFDDDYSRRRHDKAPIVRQISSSQRARENVDTREEIEWGNRMSAERNMFLQRLVSSVESDRKSKAPHFVPAVPESGASTRSRTSRRGQEPSRDEVPFMYYVPGTKDPPTPAPARLSTSARERPVQRPSPATPVASRPAEERTMLQQTWHMMLNSDPLVDSDEENPDQHVRLDYTRRLDIINHIRGRPPTPEPNQSLGEQSLGQSRLTHSSFTRRWQQLESWD